MLSSANRLHKNFIENATIIYALLNGKQIHIFGEEHLGKVVSGGKPAIVPVLYVPCGSQEDVNALKAEGQRLKKK